MSEFIAKAWKIIRQTREGNQNSYQYIEKYRPFNFVRNTDVGIGERQVPDEHRMVVELEFFFYRMQYPGINRSLQVHYPVLG